MNKLHAWKIKHAQDAINLNQLVYSFLSMINVNTNHIVNHAGSNTRKSIEIKRSITKIKMTIINAFSNFVGLFGFEQRENTVIVATKELKVLTTVDLTTNLYIKSDGWIVGDKVIVLNGPFKNIEGQIDEVYGDGSFIIYLGGTKFIYFWDNELKFSHRPEFKPPVPMMPGEWK